MRSLPADGFAGPRLFNSCSSRCNLLSVFFLDFYSIWIFCFSFFFFCAQQLKMAK
jgi:hypothetical protein